jgi:hypothetical protein
MSRYRKTMNEALTEVNNRHNINEATIISDISDVTIPVLKKQAKEMTVKVKRVTPGMFSDYEVEFEGSEQNLIKYAKKWLGYGGTSFSGLKKDLAMESVEGELQEVNLKEFEEVELKEFSVDQISKLAKSYADLAGKTMSMDNVNKLRKIFDKIPDSSLNDLRKKKIPFISGLALSRMIQKKMPVTEDMSQGFVVKFSSKKDGKIGSAWYKAEKDAKEFLSKLKSDGGNGVISKNDGKYFDEDKHDCSEDGLPKSALLKIKKAIEIAKKMSGNLTGATKEIEKIATGLSKVKDVETALMKANEELEHAKEGKMSDIHNMMKDGKSAAEIAKALKLNPKTLKDILGEVQEANDVPATDKKEPTEEGESVEKQLMAALAQVALLKQKLENEKNKAVKPKPNPITGEVPLTVGIAHAEFKKEKEVKETYIVKYVDPLNKKNLRMKHPNEKDAQDMKDRLKKSGVKEIEIVKEAMSDKENRVQRAKDMIKYYDAQKKAALKGKNKDLAKKMLKNEMTGAANLVDKILSKKLKGEK